MSSRNHSAASGLRRCMNANSPAGRVTRAYAGLCGAGRLWAVLVQTRSDNGVIGPVRPGCVRAALNSATPRDSSGVRYRIEGWPQQSAPGPTSWLGCSLSRF
jgi:hypothetical protein